MKTYNTYYPWMDNKVATQTISGEKATILREDYKNNISLPGVEPQSKYVVVKWENGVISYRMSISDFTFH